MRDAFGEKTPKTLIKILDHAPWKCVTSHLPRTAVVFHAEPNFSRPNPPNLPELNPCYLCLFWRIKNGLKFRSFASLKKFKIKQQQVQQPSQIAVTEIQHTWSTAVDSVYVQKGSTVSGWLRVCIYHAVYRLCPSSRKFCHSNLHTSMKESSEFWLWVEK
jgi:hypothetical protein